VNLLFDTHAFLWFISGDKRMSETSKAAVLDTKNHLFFSAASYWEICIKQSLGKLGLIAGWQNVFDTELATNDIKWLAVEKSHCQGIVHLPMTHRDPFDRLLISQAQTEGMALLTADETIKKYSVKTLW